jgi:hypothetical protein
MRVGSMSQEHVSHAEIAAFAEERVNLPQDKAIEYREQVRNLREKLDAYIEQHPDFTLKKMLLSGSLAKGTALRNLNDIDVAGYISGADSPSDTAKLMRYLAERLRSAYPNMTPDQIEPQTHSVTVKFKTSGLNVDVVPVLYYGNPEWYGYLHNKDDGTRVKTNIRYHIDFTKRRKAAHPTDFATVVRLAKFWAQRMKAEREGFRFKSIMIEMILAKLSDAGQSFADYPEALQAFFTYVIRSNMRERIVFTDYYAADTVGKFSEPVQIIDPVNAENNIAKLYTATHADMIVDAATDAGDAIDGAFYAPTKGETVRYWQKVLGPSFQP